jgi:hypothetical protein
MDPAPRELAPGGPGATGAPLIDKILSSSDLAGAVFAHLAPRDVLGLRAACRGAKAAVAGHAWGSPTAAHSWAWSPRPPLDVRVQAAAEFGDGFDGAYLTALMPPPPPAADVSGGDAAAALARWRACFPHARGVVVRDDSPPHSAVTNADVAPLAAGVGGGQLVRLGLVMCHGLTDAALVPFSSSRLTALTLVWMPTLTGACWAGLAERLRSVTTHGTGPVTDAHLPALSSCTHVALGSGAAVSDVGVAAHLAQKVTHLSLDVAGCPDFDGSCLLSCTRLVDLRLYNGDTDELEGFVPITFWRGRWCRTRWRAARAAWPPWRWSAWTAATRCLPLAVVAAGCRRCAARRCAGCRRSRTPRFRRAPRRAWRSWWRRAATNSSAAPAWAA